MMLRSRGGVWPFLKPLGETLPQLPDGEGLPRRMVSSSPLGNEHPSPASSKISRILIACARPPKNKQSLKVATAECLLRGTSLEARGTLRRNCAYACEQFHEKWGGAREGRAPSVARTRTTARP